MRNLIRAGVPQSVAMRISGHKTASVFTRYNIVDERDVVDAGRKLESYDAEQGRGGFGRARAWKWNGNRLTSLLFNTLARSPSGKAKVCKTFIGGSIPPRASNSPPSS